MDAMQCSNNAGQDDKDTKMLLLVVSEKDAVQQ